MLSPEFFSLSVGNPPTVWILVQTLLYIWNLDFSSPDYVFYKSSFQSYHLTSKMKSTAACHFYTVSYLSLVSIIFDRSESISTYYFPIFLNNCPANSCHFYMNLASRCALLCPQPEGKHTVKNLPTCYNLPWDYTLDCTAMPITSQANKIKRFVLLLCKVTLQSLNQDTFDVSGSYGSC